MVDNLTSFIARNPEMQLKLLQCSLDLHIYYGHKYVHMPGLTLVLLLIFSILQILAFYMFV